MSSEKQNNDNNSLDSSYGGSTYRLSYDHKENKKNKEKNPTAVKTVLTAVIVAAILFAALFFALKYYDDALEKLYASETASEGETEAGSQSRVNIISD